MPRPKTPPRTIMLTACEPSADRLGAALIEGLKKLEPGLQFIGAGGPAMAAAGQVQTVEMRELAVMGLVEVLSSIPRIRRHVQRLVELVQIEQPDALITIDAWDFSSRLTARALAVQPGLCAIQYNPPKAWAWRAGRVQALKKLYHRVLSILPFEIEFFKAHGVAVDYVGHPLTEALAPVVQAAAGQPRELKLALLPGSRVKELHAHWPVFYATFLRLKKLVPQLTAVLVLTDPAHEQICQELAPWGEGDLSVVVGEARFAALARCTAALAKSGTSNLELAVLNVPAVVAYHMHPVSYWLAKRLVRVPFISLPNLIAGRAVLPEFIQRAVKPENLARALYPWLSKPAQHAAALKGLQDVQAKLTTPVPPGEAAARAVLATLKNSA